MGGNGFVRVPLEGRVEEVRGYELADCFLPFEVGGFVVGGWEAGEVGWLREGYDG